MIQAKKINTIISSLLLAVLLSLSFIYALTSSLHFRYTPVGILGVCCGMLVVYTIIFWNKLSRRIGFIVAGTAILCAIIYFIKKGTFANYVDQLEIFSIWFYDYMLGNVGKSLQYETYATLAISFIITLPVFLITVKRFSFPLILLGGIALYVSQWILEFFVSYGAFYLFLFGILLCYFRHIYYKKRLMDAGDYISALQFTLWVAPISALVFVIAFHIPASSKPIEWKWLDEKIMSFSDYFSSQYSNSFSKFDYFSIEYTGFGKNGKLGGKVRLDNTVVLEVKGEKPVYLKAAGKDTYTSTAWVDTDKSSTDINTSGNLLENNLMEISVGLPFLFDTSGTPNLDEVFFSNTFDITFQGLKTKSLFIPALTQKIEFTSNPEPSVAINGNSTIVMDKTKDRNFNYTTNSITVNYNDPNLINLLRRSRKGLYEDIAKHRVYSQAFRSNSRNNPVLIPGGQSRSIRYIDYVNHLTQSASDINLKYTQIPETVPQRVWDLTNEITVSQENNYDKVKAIEQYLSSNFPYTLNPRSTPKGRDFVDYFLFDLKEGYCTYYASAMAIMVRSMGLPARYVEGYMMPSAAEAENTYIVTNEKAHSWVEVYFEGFGWIPFEPTAAFTANFYASNTSVEPSGDTGEELFPEELEEETSEQNNDPGDTGIGDGAEEAATGLSVTVIASIVLLSVLILGFIVLVTVNTIRSRRRINKIMHMNTREGVLAFYKHFMHLLKLQGYGIKTGETPAQYSDRVDRYLLLRPISFSSITDIFIIARYSINTLEETSKTSCLEFYRIITENCKKEMGKGKFYLYKYLFGTV